MNKTSEKGIYENRGKEISTTEINKRRHGVKDEYMKDSPKYLTYVHAQHETR